MHRKQIKDKPCAVCLYMPFDLETNGNPVKFFLFLATINRYINLVFLFIFPGYFCTSGQNMSNPFPCEPGYYCEQGSTGMTKCPSGQYQDESAQSQCKPCPAGLYQTLFTIRQPLRCSVLVNRHVKLNMLKK